MKRQAMEQKIFEAHITIKGLISKSIKKFYKSVTGRHQPVEK